MEWMRGKLGLSSSSSSSNDDDDDLVSGLLSTMAHTQCDFTDTFLALQALACGDVSEGITLDRLLSRCATPDNVSQQLKRKVAL